VTAGLRHRAVRVGRAATTLVLDLLALKPIAVFVWAFSQRANTIHFPERARLLARIDGALAAGRPVVVAANHVSWFDDPVIPMALYRSGPRAALELGGLALLLAVAAFLPASLGLGVGLAGALGIAAFGVNKPWWTLGDLVNLSDASVLRGKLALTRKAPPGPLLRVWLRLADVLIPWFMRSGTVRTIFVDRRAGEEARQVRERALEAALAVAARPEPVWVFFEGGRTKLPGRIAPARRGVGALILGLRKRGLEPLVLVVVHRGMERLIPPGGRRFLSTGHRVEVRWAEFDTESCASASRGDDQELADAIREQALRLDAAARTAETPPG
jgi:1-acyl-sn-glycerol-3-phosphate acyltransferase